MGLGLNWYQIGIKTCHILKFIKFYEKNMFLLTDPKVPSLASKCVIYRPEHNAKGGPHESEF